MIEKLINICKDIEQPERTVLYLNPSLLQDIKDSVKDKVVYHYNPVMPSHVLCGIHLKGNIYLEHDVVIEIVMVGENIDKMKVHRLNEEP